MAVSDRLSRIVDRLTRTIPNPPAAIARPAASFATLRVGQRLADAELTRWQVASCDSLGANLTSEHGTTCRLTDRAWKDAGWSRVRQPHKRKAIP